MQGALVQFLDNGDGVRFPLIVNWLHKMKRIEKWIEEQTLFSFYSSSILLIYDGCAPENCTDQQVLKADVHMIDFAHTHPNSISTATRDNNYLHGLRSVIRMLEDILRPVLTPEMQQQLGYELPVQPQHPLNGDEETDNGAPQSGTFDIRHLFNRIRPNRARTDEATTEASELKGSTDSDSVLIRSENHNDRSNEPGGNMLRAASAPIFLKVADENQTEYKEGEVEGEKETEDDEETLDTRLLSLQTRQKRRSFSLSSSPKP